MQLGPVERAVAGAPPVVDVEDDEAPRGEELDGRAVGLGGRGCRASVGFHEQGGTRPRGRTVVLVLGEKRAWRVSKAGEEKSGGHRGIRRRTV